MVATGLYLAHGWLMWAAFGVIFPFGIFISRFGRLSTKRYVLLHHICQAIGLVTAIVGFSIAVSEFGALRRGINSPLHTVLGVAIFTALLLHVLLAELRPRTVGTPVRGAWYVTHFTFGVGLVGIAWYNIFLGISLFKSIKGRRGSTIQILWAIWICLLAWLYLILQRWKYVAYESRGIRDKSSMSGVYVDTLFPKDIRNERVFVEGPGGPEGPRAPVGDVNTAHPAVP
eukprot:TRINITY_DN32984_c0_g1_i1.p1 TRINITY_DN32984_c0_g1~~TRINITY_DN32984_c0_g1_i1.p1  ORF type:complete len:229 (-),score=8.88 TRINITY_DN32984_c0_g1_i1:345-1031(-)